MVINTPVQGSASDIVVDAMNRLSIISQLEDKPYLQPRINIHDDLTFYLPKRGLDSALERIIYEMLNVPFNWISVPISVGVSTGPSWGELEEIGVFKSNEVLDAA